MIKQLIAVVALLAVGFLTTFAADEKALTGQVASIDGNSVVVTVAGDLPSWAKKGGYLRATAEDGKLILRGAKITAVEGNTLTVTTTKAKEMSVGATYTLGKGKASAGC